MRSSRKTRLQIHQRRCAHSFLPRQRARRRGTMGDGITKLHFAQSCARIGKFAVQWGADSLDFLDDAGDLEKPETVFRFTDEMRSRLRYLDERAGRPRPDPATCGKEG